jgi:electron transfer flavoprotein alpha subunit
MSGVLVVLEQRGGAWNRMSWEALAAGLQIADGTGVPLHAAVAGKDPDALLPEVQNKAVVKCHVVRHELLGQYTQEAFTVALEQLVRRMAPSFVVFPHTYQVRDFVPRLATRFREVLIPDIVGLEMNGGRVAFTRQLMAGKLNATYRHAGSGPCFVSVQAGAFRADGLPSGSAEIDVFTPEIDPTQIATKPGAPFRDAAQAVDLSAAEIIVSVGRGIKEKENMPIVEELAQALGAELAASRPICDNGWLPMDRQVGSSGQTVSPKVYLAVGISGAIQHLVGMKGSKAVVAINKDENAPIFEIADYGIVGDLFEVVPALTAAVNKAKAAGA